MGRHLLSPMRLGLESRLGLALGLGSRMGLGPIIGLRAESAPVRLSLAMSS